MRLQVGTALGDAGEASLDTIQRRRGDMLLMLACNRHHGMPALPGARDGLQGAPFNLWTPDAKHRHHQPNTTQLDPNPPLEALAVAGNLSSWDRPSVEQVLWLGTGAVATVGLWERDAAQALFTDAPEVAPSAPPTFPYHGTFLSRCAPADVLAVMEVAEHLVLFFAGLVHQLEVTKEGSVYAEQKIHFAISSFAPPPPCGPPRCSTWGTGPLRTRPHRGTAPSARAPGPHRSAARAIARCAPCAIPCVCLLFRQIG